MAQRRSGGEPTEARAVLADAYKRMIAEYGGLPGSPWANWLERLEAGEAVECDAWQLTVELRPIGAGPGDRLRVDGDGTVTIVGR